MEAWGLVNDIVGGGQMLAMEGSARLRDIVLGGVSLSRLVKEVADADSASTKVASFRQALVGLKAKLQWPAHMKHDVRAPVASSVLEWAKALVELTSVVDTKMKEKAIATSTAALEAAVASLQPFAGGALEGKLWSEGLIAGATFDDLVTHADKTLLATDFPYDTFDKRIQDIKSALDTDKEARSTSGDVSEVKLHATAELVYKRAALTYSEKGLIEILRHKKRSAEIRGEIQPLIRRIRASGMLEKQVLPTSLFAVAYAALANK